MYKVCAACLHWGNSKFKQRPREEQAEVAEPKGMILYYSILACCCMSNSVGSKAVFHVKLSCKIFIFFLSWLWHWRETCGVVHVRTIYIFTDSVIVIQDMVWHTLFVTQFGNLSDFVSHYFVQVLFKLFWEIAWNSITEWLVTLLRSGESGIPAGDLGHWFYQVHCQTTHQGWPWICEPRKKYATGVWYM